MSSNSNGIKTGHSYNDAVHARIVEATSIGATRTLAAQAGGVGVRTLQRWLADARRNEDSPFKKLLDDVISAEGESGVRALRCVQRAAAEGRWSAAAWLLERKHGYRKDGVKELQTHASIPGNLDSHEAEILGEVRRLRIAATSDGSHVAAARLLDMEAQMVAARKEEARLEAERTHADANQDELLSLIAGQAEGMPKAVLDKLVDRLSEIRKKAS